MTTVTLIDRPQHSIETLYVLWQASRNSEPLLDPADLAERSMSDPELREKILTVFGDVLDAGIPVAENLNFTFVLEDVSIALREQMVRHRIGVHVGSNFGVDIVPDLAHSTWWSQSMRILDMSRFADHNCYELPDAVMDAAPWPTKTTDPADGTAEGIYQRCMQQCQDAYRKLLAMGVPMEDARMVIPLAATSRISWTVNLAALKHIVGKRGCWILQLGLWKPVIEGMVEELASKVHPFFRRLIDPPCIRRDKFIGCCFAVDNVRRVVGEDNLPPCSLYLHHHGDEVRVATRTGPRRWNPAVTARKSEAEHRPYRPSWTTADEHQLSLFNAMLEDYRLLWGRNPHTGTRLA